METNNMIPEGVQEAVQEAMPAVQETAQQAGNWFSELKERLSLDAMMEKIRMSRDSLIDAAIYGGIGFLSGFLLKKYSSYVMVIGLVVIGLVALHQFEVINIAFNWAKIDELFGIQHVPATGDAMNMVWAWVKANALIAGSYGVGFIIGLKLG